MKRKIFAVFVMIGMIISSINIPLTAHATDYSASRIVDYVNNRLGESYDYGYCLKFVEECYENVYGFRRRYPCAYESGTAYIDSTSRDNIPLGATVYFGGSSVICSSCGHNAGHVAIYVGDGYIVHNWAGKIQKTTIDYIVSRSYPYRGYGWMCDVPLTTDTTPPKITGFYPSNISSSSFTINCSANEILSSAYIILYCPAGEKSISVNNINSSSFSRTINTSDYGGTGTYNLHIYVYDLAGNVSSTGSGDFQVQNLAVTGVTITNKTSSSFTVNCTTNNTISSSYFVIYGPGGEYNCSINNINSRSFSKKLYIADYGGAGTYVLHVYVTDSAGNTVGYSTHEFAAPGEYPSTPSISIHVGNENEPTTISWYSQYAKDYWVSIRNSDDTWYTSVMNTANTSWTNQFKPGTYKIHVEAVNDYGRTSYGYVSFTVPQVGTYISTTATRSSSRIEVQTSISNLSQSAQCVMAVYSSDGKLLGQTANDVNSNAQSVTAYFPNDSNASYVKVFLWDSLQGMKPLTNGEKVNIQ